jgi:MFS transporter, DHA1 family, multidrug resistance protein
VTAVDANPDVGAKAHVALGSKGFVAIVSLCMAVTALGIDTILPAYGEIRESLGLAEDATEVTGLITFYLMGNSIGLLPAGLLSDRFGRRAVMWGGLALYIVGAVGSVLAPSLTWMFVARFVWGLGGAGPRVAALATIRDGFAGEQMAKQMSFVMAVFLLVPAVGPSLSAGILAVGPWQAVVWTCVVAAVTVAFLVTRLPETLPPSARRPLSADAVRGGLRIVFVTPGTVGYLVSLTALFGVFMSYLASSELIIDQTFGLGRWFPAFFGGIALFMLVAMLVNGRFVVRLGLARLLRITFAGYFVSVLALLTVALATGGEPAFWLFVALIASVLFFQQMLIPNINASAMRPLAEVAGTGAAIIGMVSGTLSAVIGEIINRQFDGTITPLATGFLISSMVAIAAWRHAERASAHLTARPSPDGMAHP